MKNGICYIIIAGIFIFTQSSTAIAQQKNKYNNNLLFTDKPVILLDSTNLKGTKVGQNELFDFYQSPIDHIICAVPNNRIKSTLQVYTSQTDLDIKIPNALGNKHLIK